MWIELLEASSYIGTGKIAENAVGEALRADGLKQLDIASLIKDSGYRNKTELVKAVRDGEFQLEPNTFYAQPLGSQNSPDFIAVTEEEVFFIEVKASKTASGYQFNTHLINNDFTYVLSDPSVGFKIFSGYQLMDPEVREILLECHMECTEVVRKHNKRLENLSNNRKGWAYYARPMYTQKNVYA